MGALHYQTTATEPSHCNAAKPSNSTQALLNWVAALATSVYGLDGLLIFGKLLLVCNHAMLASRF